MKKAIFLVLCVMAVSAGAQAVHRDGYIRKDGVYVPPSYSTAPNATKMDNYSTKGNVNPYTGKQGTVDPYKQPEPVQQYQNPYMKNPKSF